MGKSVERFYSKVPVIKTTQIKDNTAVKTAVSGPKYIFFNKKGLAFQTD